MITTLTFTLIWLVLVGLTTYAYDSVLRRE
jgi:hypothetical protein